MKIRALRLSPRVITISWWDIKHGLDTGKAGTPLLGVQHNPKLIHNQSTISGLIFSNSDYYLLFHY